MALRNGHSKSFQWLVLFLVLAAVLAGLQLWNAVSMHAVVSHAESTAGQTSTEDVLKREAARQELIGKQIENSAKGNLLVNLTSGLSAAVATLAAIIGALIALRSYVDTREKDRLDRLAANEKEATARDKDRLDRQAASEKEAQTREKERQDRIAAALSETIGRLVSTEWRQRVVGTAGLLPFFTADRKDFHPQALAALIAAARFKEEEIAVRQGIRLAVERAVRTVAPQVLAEISWQGVQLSDVNLPRACLAALDLRDAVLENARLEGADLSGANLTAARLQGAMLTGARLDDVNLTYADLAGASLAKASVARASLSNLKVFNLDLEGADLRDIGPAWRSVPWDATRNWRQAVFDEPVRAELERLYGAAVPKLRVMMLMWEIPPMVAGGTWTACYHLVRNLRRRGADVTVVVPWKRDALLLDPPPFGVDVPIVTLDVDVPVDAVDPVSWSPYGGPRVPAPYSSGRGYTGWSPYGGGGALWSGYTQFPGSAYGGAYGGGYGGPYGGPYDGPYSYAGPYGAGLSAYGAGALAGSTLFRLITEFARKLRAHVAENPADLIHAHDWVTFDAARTAAERLHVPWIAHFHSTEVDRQQDYTDPLTERIEQGALDSATRVVTVSEATRRAMIDRYQGAAGRAIEVVPNTLSEEPVSTADMGRFETHRVVFLGRLSRQKGVDRFCEVADRVRQSGFVADFVAYGDGPERGSLYQHRVASAGAIGWDKRGAAFRGASAVLVPSRSEPFGMVILEAMQHRVPVIYPAESGAAEVLVSGVKIAADDIAGMAEAVMRLLGDLRGWEESVAASAAEIERYPRKAYEDRLVAVWSEAVAGHARGRAAGPNA